MFLQYCKDFYFFYFFYRAFFTSKKYVQNPIAGKLLATIFLPPNRNETAMAAPSPWVSETDTSAPRVDENNNNNNNNSNQPPRVVDTKTTTTAIDRLRNRVRTNPVRNQSQNELTTKSVQNSAGSRQEKTKSVQKLQSITEAKFTIYHRYYN
jgi:hypothetical protein